MEPRAGERFGNYLVESCLAETRMSRVWLARHLELNRRIALKTVRSIPDNIDIVEAAKAGAVLQQMLCEQDRRVVRVHAHGEHDGHYYIDMEYVDGRDVSHIVSERGLIAPDTCVKIALEVAELLDNLHNFSTTIDGRVHVAAVHGDLKPKNIRIAGDLKDGFAVKVLDFGTAKALSQSRPGGTRTPAWTPAYASPELLERREMNPLSDRWALGVTLYEMVTGRVPFGAGKSVEEIETQIRSRTRPPDLGLPDCPAALHAIIFKLLDPDPERRYRSAGELCRDLRNYPEMPKVAGYQGETVRSDAPRPQPRPLPTGATTRASAWPDRPVNIPARAPAPQRDPLVRYGLMLLAAMLSVLFFMRQSNAWGAARRLESELAAERVSLADARKRLTDLDGRWMVWFPRGPILRLMSRGLLERGDAIVTRYRTTPLRSADWEEARGWFQQAQELTPGDESLKGRVRLCDGHLKRFQSDSDKEVDINVAVQRFEEAAALLPKSPDPWLGFAVVEIYNRKEPVKAEEALSQARERGFDFTNEARWVAGLADCYRARADTLVSEADRIGGTLPEQAAERLDRAIKYHDKAIAWYATIPLQGNSLRNIERCRAVMPRLQEKLAELRATRL